MLSKKQRLDRVAFAAVYKKGRRAHTPGLQLVYLSAPDFRAAAVVGQKVAPGAVRRNLLRRRLYAALAERFADGEVQNGHVIVVAKPALAAYSYARLRDEVLGALAHVVGFKGDLR
jgi:ribonuclease P protein component